MSNPQLLNYINQQLANGVPQEKIKSDLLSAGWHAYELEDAFRFVEPAYQEPLRQVASQPDAQLGSQPAAEPLTADLNNQGVSAGIPPEQITPIIEANPIDTSLPGTQGQRLAKDDLYKDVLGPAYSQRGTMQAKPPLKTPIEIILLPIVAVVLLIGGGVFAYLRHQALEAPENQFAEIIETPQPVAGIAEEQALEPVVPPEGIPMPVIETPRVETPRVVVPTPRPPLPVRPASPLSVDIRIPKDVYRVGEAFGGAQYVWSYRGEPFEAVFLTGESRRGFEGVSTGKSILIEMIQNDGVLPFRQQAFRIDRNGFACCKDSFSEAGEYKLTLTVFRCADLGLGDDCSIRRVSRMMRNGLLPGFQPAASATRVITVVD